MYERKLLKHLPDFWDKDDSNLQKLMSVIAPELKELRRELTLQKTFRTVDNAPLETLKQLAIPLNISKRPNESGESFRNRIKSHIEGITGGGTLESLTFAVEKLLGGNYFTFDQGTGEFEFWYRSLEQPVSHQMITETLNKYKAGGIHITVEAITGWQTEVNIQEDGEPQAARVDLVKVGHNNVVGS